MSDHLVTPIGFVRSPRLEVADDHWGGMRSTIELSAERFGPEALEGLDAFSHAEVVYLFDRVAGDAVETGARHPRGNPAWPRVGVFAQRVKNRPNRLGVSRCRIVSVTGLTVAVEGLDAVDGTPVLGIKPYMAEFGPIGPVHQPAWATELMRDYYSPPPSDGSGGSHSR
jgi:tRNA-Thr(GGU) m(6)t(6)A37 methyltransferase TsaA